MAEPPLLLCAERREIVLSCLISTTSLREWSLFAAHVRANHVHVIVSSEPGARQTIAYLKARASHALRTAGLGAARTWAAGGSYRKLDNEEAVRRAVDYVVRGQGDPMAVYEA
jgi:hypothetical protein